MSRNTLNTLKDFKLSAGQKGKFYSLPELAKQFLPLASWQSSLEIKRPCSVQRSCWCPRSVGRPS